MNFRGTQLADLITRNDGSRHVGKIPLNELNKDVDLFDGSFDHFDLDALFGLLCVHDQQEFEIETFHPRRVVAYFTTPAQHHSEPTIATTHERVRSWAAQHWLWINPRGDEEIDWPPRHVFVNGLPCSEFVATDSKGEPINVD